MCLKRNTVLLLKSERSGDVEDKYETLLKSRNFEVIQVKTLDFVYKNIEILREQILKPADFSGIILSSPRCVTAVQQALEKKQIKELWGAKSNFVVGEATHKEAFTKLGLKCNGKETGNASNLSKLIISDKTEYCKPFLFPHSNLKTDTLKLELGKEKLGIEGVLVYDTIANPNIEKELSIATGGFMEMPEFVIFFSPSGLRSSINFLRKVPVDLTLVKFVAIGPVTELAMREAGLNIHATAKNPTPEEVLNTII